MYKWSLWFFLLSYIDVLLERASANLNGCCLTAVIISPSTFLIIGPKPAIFFIESVAVFLINFRGWLPLLLWKASILQKSSQSIWLLFLLIQQLILLWTKLVYPNTRTIPFLLSTQIKCILLDLNHLLLVSLTNYPTQSLETILLKFSSTFQFRSNFLRYFISKYLSFNS